jgi:two-component system chemotaxis response regulator CheB
VLRALPAGLPACVLVVQHLARRSTSVLARLLQRSSALPVHEARGGEAVAPGVVYVAPPDHHLIVSGERLGLTDAAPVLFSRPSIDVLFTSVAQAFGDRVVGVILSGAGRDGARGLRAIQDHGGTTIVQDPKDAAVERLPLAALAEDHIDQVLPLHAIGVAITLMVKARTSGIASTNGIPRPDEP